MNTEQERYKFEAWAVPHFMKQVSELYRQGETESWPGRYGDYAIQCAWEAWQARAAECRVPEVVKKLADDMERAEGAHANDGYMWDASECANYLRERADALLQSAPQLKQAPDEWVKCSDRMPAHSNKVIGIGKNRQGKWRRIICRWVPKHTIEVTDFDDFCEEPVQWSEDENTAYWPEGWYECVENWGELTDLKVGDITMVAWMELPKPPEQS